MEEWPERVMLKVISTTVQPHLLEYQTVTLIQITVYVNTHLTAFYNPLTYKTKCVVVHTLLNATDLKDRTSRKVLANFQQSFGTLSLRDNTDDH